MAKEKEVIRRAVREGGEIAYPKLTARGDAAGPHLVVTAGIHGCEYTGIEACYRLFSELNTRTLSGTVTMIPIASLDAFWQRHMFTSPADRKNPNRCFPGDPGGSYTEQLDALLFEEIRRGDYYLDLHAGDLVEELDPMTLIHRGGSADVYEASRKLAEAYDIRNVVETGPGVSWDDGGTTYANAARAGIPAAIVESGGNGLVTEENIAQHNWGLVNVMRALHMLPGSASVHKCELFSDFEWLYTPVRGLCETTVRAGDEVTAGQELGVVRDLLGDVAHRIVSPRDGRVLFRTTSLAVGDNGLLMGIAVRSEGRRDG